MRSSYDGLSLLNPATSFYRVASFSCDIIPTNNMAYDRAKAHFVLNTVNRKSFAQVEFRSLRSEMAFNR